MQFYKKSDVRTVSLYAVLALGCFLLYGVGDNGEPFHLALAYAMSTVGIAPLFASVSFVAPVLFSGKLTAILVTLGQAVLLYVGWLLHIHAQKRAPDKAGFFPFCALSLSLGAFIWFAPFTPYPLPFSFSLHPVFQKVCVVLAVFLLCPTCSIALRAVLTKTLKCRLRADECVYSVFFFVLLGIGACKLFSVNAYLGIAFFLLLFFGAITKDATSLVVAFVLSLPPFAVAGLPITRFFLYGVTVTLFSKLGKLPLTLAYLCVFFALGYFDGLYAYSPTLLAQSLVSALVPATVFLLLPTPFLRFWENKLVFYREKHLSRVAINRNRASIGKQLYEISSVFREIESTFYALDNSGAETSAKSYMKECIVGETCKACTQYTVCKRKEMFAELDTLIEVGCMKGKTSLIDVPKRLGETCINQNALLHAVNTQIADYKRYMTEAENASAGRGLLAKQSQGVSEILRELALEQSEPLRIYTDKERALSVALLKVGIVCSEVLIYGEDPTVSLITFGKSDVKTVAQICTKIMNEPMMISERIVLSGDKYCCILRKKPYYDAVFGVATRAKDGESASGDTHSVIKINESKFMVALSDGMGSGEYAKRISESTITLLESFYRAKMPSDCILSTVNKLLTFNKEESFACVDIAVVDLNSGQADIVKIGSPNGFILSGSAVRVLEGSALPLGILDCMHPDSASYDLQENDVLLFLSDGITDAFPSTADLYDLLKRVPVRNPQQLADNLLNRALEAYGGTAKDDMTVVAVRLFKPRLAS